MYNMPYSKAWIHRDEEEHTEHTKEVTLSSGGFLIELTWLNGDLYKVFFKENDSTSGFARIMKPVDLMALKDLFEAALKEVTDDI